MYMKNGLSEQYPGGFGALANYINPWGRNSHRISFTHNSSIYMKHFHDIVTFGYNCFTINVKI